MTECGIYAICNEINGKMYIGSSCRLSIRRQAHWNDLNKNKHKNPRLQHAWNKYGGGAFVFRVLELCARPDLLTREQYYINMLGVADNGYNCKRYTTGFTAEEFTPEHRANIAAALRGRRCVPRGPMPEATKEKLRQSKLGKPLTEAHKRTLSKVRQGHAVSQKSIDVLVARNKANTGSKHTDETKRKIAELRQGKKHSPETIKRMSDARAAFWERKRKEKVS